MGNEANSPAAQTASLLIHFPPRTIGSATCEFDSKAESKAESKASSKARSKARSNPRSKAAVCRSSMCLSIACAMRRKPHYGCVDVRLSHFLTCTGTRRAATLRRLLLLPFLGEARKGSSCRSTTGQQSHNNDRIKNKTRTTARKNTTKPARIFHAAYRPVCLKKRMEYALWQGGVAANRIPFSAACVRLCCANLTYAGLRRGGSRTTDVLTFAFRMWRCRLCWAENGLERFVFERSEFRTFPIF
jgi:hypothetical protein